MDDVSGQFCGRGDEMCEQLVCHLGNLEVGREASIHLEVKLNPNVLLQAPVKHTEITSFCFLKACPAALLSWLVISARRPSSLIIKPF